MNTFKRFITENSNGEPIRLAWLAAASGLASALMLGLVNSAVNLAAEDKALRWTEGAMFVAAFAFYYLAMKLALYGANALIERLLRKLRVRFTNRIRHSELAIVEPLGRGELFTSLSQTTSRLSHIFPLVVNSLQELIIVIFCFFYIGYLSTVAFIVLVVATGLTVRQYQKSRAAADRHYRQRLEGEAELLDSLSHMVDGFKEIRINKKKRMSLFETFKGLTQNLRDLAFDIAEAQVFLFLVTATFLYIMLGAMAYVLPQYLDVEVFKLCAALLFCIGPLASVVGLMPLLWTAEAGLKSIYRLEELLEAGIREPLDPQPSSAELADFEQIKYRGITFRYGKPNDQETFRSGPWDITLNRGELLFIVGGNGSGKSTVLKLLSGLYEAESGTIQVDDKPLSPGDRPGLRELFSCVFSDFHLFDKLYGAEDADPARVDELLKEMGLAEKVRFQDGRFSDIHLSTGQRKRLALIASLLEDKDIYIFDEWTADQDAHFREYFYRQVLPDLQKSGKTVIVVTHDDRYWNVADRVLKFEYGVIVDSESITE